MQGLRDGCDSYTDASHAEDFGQDSAAARGLLANVQSAIEACGLANKLEELSRELSREGIAGPLEERRRVDGREDERLGADDRAKPVLGTSCVRQRAVAKVEAEVEGEEEEEEVVVVADAELLRLEMQGFDEDGLERQGVGGGGAEVVIARGSARLFVRREVFGWWAHCAGMSW